jgi:small subunit ribosomal protein S21
MEEAFNHGKKGLSVRVINNNVDGAISRLKRLLNQEGITRELRARRYYEKPTTKRRRERAEARIRWLRKKATLDPFQ